ncbi:MAG: hypothetical protein IJC66_07605 [Kiritimatiellae bacterium]|nr:hypothetical protein [Kiritimatiellia bacterium]MBR6588503.1 hypothetical protein [Kiritimatiellia bacterium]
MKKSLFFAALATAATLSASNSALPRSSNGTATFRGQTLIRSAQVA